MEVKPRLDLWCENSSVWSLPTFTTTTSATTTQSKKKKGVHFARRLTKVHEIIHIIDYTPEEVQNCWFTRSERRQMVANRNACVARLDAWLDLPSEDNAMEGLERTCETRQSIAHIQQAIHAVLSEQYDQRIYGLVDPDYIALRYKAVVDSFPKNRQEQDMPNPVGNILLTEQSVRYHEVAPMA
eukprot:CAMPEP_0113657666 /NCGR_PEP_ID=MMETSP0017_2-20120614/31200_1 /TAXON_ID=2856 /ORGANISM="Cylindrotheca closterium" /LENGTH=183 /DNA_ID=CAMNT_0000571673 /DNA_START=218 /DNA_END=769 /DNA_ORIENTATION=- /assembly_acc=CAM_ASM_000147